MAQILDFAAARKAKQERLIAQIFPAPKPTGPRRVRQPDGRTMVYMGCKERA